MSNKYKDGDKVPASVICDRLYVLSCALTQGRDAFEREFTMRIPAELDRDPDLVMSGAANIIEEQQEEITTLREQLREARKYELTEYWLVTRYLVGGLHPSKIVEEVVKGPLTDEVALLEGDEAVQLYKQGDL